MEILIGFTISGGSEQQRTGRARGQPGHHDGPMVFVFQYDGCFQGISRQIGYHAVNLIKHGLCKPLQAAPFERFCHLDKTAHHCEGSSKHTLRNLLNQKSITERWKITLFELSDLPLLKTIQIADCRFGLQKTRNTKNSLIIKPRKRETALRNDLL